MVRGPWQTIQPARRAWKVWKTWGWKQSEHAATRVASEGISWSMERASVRPDIWSREATPGYPVRADGPLMHQWRLLRKSERLVRLAGHYQVADQHPAPRQAVGAELQRPDLSVHLPDRLAGALGVVLRLGQPAGGLALPELEVRHVDVHNPVQQLQRGERVVPAGVVDDRQPQAARNGRGEGLDDLGRDVLGRDEVDVVAATPLERQHQRSDPLGWALGADGPLADVPVLAEDATQVAEAEEDRPRAVAAPQAILLAEVGAGAGDARVTAGVTDAGLVRHAVDMTI